MNVTCAAVSAGSTVARAGSRKRQGLCWGVGNESQGQVNGTIRDCTFSVDYFYFLHTYKFNVSSFNKISSKLIYHKFTMFCYVINRNKGP